MSDISLQSEVEIFVQDRKILKKDFAKTIGITPVKLSHWLKVRVALDRKTIEKLIAVLERL